MKRNLDTLCALFLILALTLSMAACGSQTTSSVTPSAEASTASPTTTATTAATVAATEAPTAAPAPTPEVKEPITLTFWGATTTQNFQSGIQDDPIAKVIQKELGITMDMEMHPTDEKFTALLASNSLSDIMVVKNKYCAQMIQGGLVKDMTGLIEAKGPDIAANLPGDSIKYAKNILSGNSGKLYFLPQNAYSVENASMPESIWGGAYTRWDYYKEMGYPKLSSTDDYLKLVSDMLKAHPANEEGKKFFGFSLWFDWGPYIQTDTMTVRAIGRETLGGTSLPVELDRLTLDTYNRYLEPTSGFWNGVNFWYKANQMGLLDPDSFTQKYDQAAAKYGSNQVLATMINWLQPNAYLTEKGTPEKGFFGPLPIKDAKYYYYNGWVTGNGQAFCIAESCKTPERAMELLNWLTSVHGVMTVANGIESVDWTKEGDVYKYTAAFEANAKDPEAASKFGYGKFINNLVLASGSNIPGTKTPMMINLSTAVQKLALDKPENVIAKEAVGYYKVELPWQILPEGQQYEKSYHTALGALMPVDMPDDMKLIDQKLDNYLKSAVIKIIAAKNDADYKAQQEKIMTDLKGLNEETLYKYWADLVAAAKPSISR